jgi:hypothetical protein
VHHERAGRQRHRAAVEDDLATGHVLDVPEADDVLDGAKELELPGREGRRLGHGGDDTRVDPQQHAGSLEAQEQIVERLGCGGRRHGVGRQPEPRHRVGLDDGAIEHPRITRPHPDDAVGRRAVGQQPHDPVGRGLARTDDDVRARRRRQPGELVEATTATSSATPNGGGVVAGIVGDR